jgi:hypothetical protein
LIWDQSAHITPLLQRSSLNSVTLDGCNPNPVVYIVIGVTLSRCIQSWCNLNHRLNANEPVCEVMRRWIVVTLSRCIQSCVTLGRASEVTLSQLSLSLSLSTHHSLIQTKWCSMNVWYNTNTWHLSFLSDFNFAVAIALLLLFNSIVSQNHFCLNLMLFYFLKFYLAHKKRFTYA